MVQMTVLRSLMEGYRTHGNHTLLLVSRTLGHKARLYHHHSQPSQIFALTVVTMTGTD
jgi:hypothetical protein